MEIRTKKLRGGKTVREQRCLNCKKWHRQYILINDMCKKCRKKTGNTVEQDLIPVEKPRLLRTMRYRV